MSIGRYLPSREFTLIVLSVSLAGGLIVAAQFFTRPQALPQVSVADTTDAASSDQNWEAALYAIQAANASTSIAAPSPDTVNDMVQAVQSPNITDSVAKTLFIKVSSATSQGLGDDAPTQDQIVAAAAAQVQANEGSSTSYTLAQLNIVPASTATLHAFGNGVIEALDAHPAASERTTLIAVGLATDNHDPTQLKNLAPVADAYAAMVRDLLSVPVPQTLAPLYLQAINNYALITASYPDMEALLDDPLRGLAGIQNYESYLDEEGRLFTNIAQELNKDGILFTKDEPGSAWSGFLLAPTGASGSS